MADNKIEMVYNKTNFTDLNGNGENNMEILICYEHRMAMNNFCEDCMMWICSICNKLHAGHHVCTATSLFTKCQQNIRNEMIPKVENSCKEKMKEKYSQQLESIKANNMQKIASVKNKFQSLYEALKIKEKIILEAMMSSSAAQVEEYEKVVRSLNHLHDKFDGIKSEAMSVDKPVGAVLQYNTLADSNAETERRRLWSDISSFPDINDGINNRNIDDLGLDLVLNMVNCLGANMFENSVKGDLNNNIEVRPGSNMSKNGIEGDLNNNLEERTEVTFSAVDTLNVTDVHKKNHSKVLLLSGEKESGSSITQHSVDKCEELKTVAKSVKVEKDITDREKLQDTHVPMASVKSVKVEPSITTAGKLCEDHVETKSVKSVKVEKDATTLEKLHKDHMQTTSVKSVKVEPGAQSTPVDLSILFDNLKTKLLSKPIIKQCKSPVTYSSQKECVGLKTTDSESGNVVKEGTNYEKAMSNKGEEDLEQVKTSNNTSLNKPLVADVMPTNSDNNNKEIASSRNFILRQMLVENENFNAQQKTTGQNLDIDVNSNFHTGKSKRTNESRRNDNVVKSNSSWSKSSNGKRSRPNRSKEKKNLSDLNREAVKKKRNYLDRDTAPDIMSTKRIPTKKRKTVTYNDLSMFETSQMDSETLDHNNKHLGSDSQNMKKGVLNVTDQTKGAVVDVNNNKEKTLRLDNVNVNNMCIGEQRRSLRKSTEIKLKRNKRLSSAASLKSSDFKIVVHSRRKRKKNKKLLSPNRTEKKIGSNLKGQTSKTRNAKNDNRKNPVKDTSSGNNMRNDKSNSKTSGKSFQNIESSTMSNPVTRSMKYAEKVSVSKKGTFANDLNVNKPVWSDNTVSQKVTYAGKVSATKASTCPDYSNVNKPVGSGNTASQTITYAGKVSATKASTCSNDSNSNKPVWSGNTASQTVTYAGKYQLLKQAHVQIKDQLFG